MAPPVTMHPRSIAAPVLSANCGLVAGRSPALLGDFSGTSTFNHLSRSFPRMSLTRSVMRRPEPLESISLSEVFLVGAAQFSPAIIPKSKSNRELYAAIMLATDHFITNVFYLPEYAPFISGALAFVGSYVLFGLAGRAYIPAINRLAAKIERDVSDPLRFFDPYPLPTFAELYKTTPALQKAVENFVRVGRQDLALLNFLGFDPQHFSSEEVVNALAKTKVNLGDIAAPDAKGKQQKIDGVNGVYAVDFRTLFLKRGTKLSTIVHEMTHALHHSAVAHAMTRQKAAHIVSIFAQFVPEAKVDDKEKAALKRISTYVNDESTIGESLSDDFRWAAANLCMNLGTRHFRNRVEALATSVELRSARLLEKAWMVIRYRVAMRAEAFYIHPLVAMGGILKGHSKFTVLNAYGNRRLYNETLELGLFDSLDPSIDKPQGLPQRFKNWLLDLVA